MGTLDLRDPPALPGWLAEHLPFDRKCARIDGDQIHFIDHGKGPVVLLVHGNPTWSFLWREVIASITAGGLRAIAPDLLGFGLSDKPKKVRTHSLPLHIGIVEALLDGLGVESMIICGQDWGGPISAGVAARRPERIRGAVFGNTAVLRPARPFRSKPFHRFSQMPILSDFAFRGLNFPLPILSRVQGDPSSIGALERRAYAYPFRRLIDRAGPLALARMVPDSESHPSTAVCDEIGTWTDGYVGPAALVWGLRDPILGRALRRHRAALPQASVTETQAGHFLQEEVPEAIARAIFEVADQQ